MDAIDKIKLFSEGYSFKEIEEFAKKTKGKKKNEIGKGILEALR